MNEDQFAEARRRLDRGELLTLRERMALVAQNNLLFQQLVRIVQAAQPQQGHQPR